MYPHYWLATPESRALSTHVGLNRVNWNLHYDDPPALRHDLENRDEHDARSTTPGPHGPQVIPGVYTLKLTVDGQVYTRNVTVINDPRVGQSPELMAALRTQNRLTLLSVQGMKQSFEGHDEVDAVREPACVADEEQPARRCRHAGQDTRCQPDEDWRRHADRLGGGGGGPNRRVAPDPKAMQSFVDLNNAYNTMVSMMQVGLDMAPTPTQIATWENDCTDYNRTTAAWKGDAATDHRLQRGAGQEQPAGAQGLAHQAHGRVMQLYAGSKQKGCSNQTGRETSNFP